MELNTIALWVSILALLILIIFLWYRPTSSEEFETVVLWDWPYTSGDVLASKVLSEYPTASIIVSMNIISPQLYSLNSIYPPTNVFFNSTLLHSQLLAYGTPSIMSFARRQYWKEQTSIPGNYLVSNTEAVVQYIPLEDKKGTVLLFAIRVFTFSGQSAEAKASNAYAAFSWIQDYVTTNNIDRFVITGKFSIIGSQWSLMIDRLFGDRVTHSWVPGLITTSFSNEGEAMSYDCRTGIIISKAYYPSMYCGLGYTSDLPLIIYAKLGGSGRYTDEVSRRLWNVLPRGGPEDNSELPREWNPVWETFKPLVPITPNSAKSRHIREILPLLPNP